MKSGGHCSTGHSTETYKPAGCSVTPLPSPLPARTAIRRRPLGQEAKWGWQIASGKANMLRRARNRAH